MIFLSNFFSFPKSNKNKTLLCTCRPFSSYEKATLGGGGKGMRLVEKAEDFEAALDACKREALKSFNDDTVG